MADTSSLHEEAVAAITERLAREFGARVMSDEELEPFKRHKPVAGMALAVRFSTGETLDLALIVSREVPFSLPRLFVIDGPPVGTWPHLEENGYLCVYPEGTSFSSHRPADVAAALVKDGVTLLEQSLSQQNGDDFQAEVISYWNLGLKNDQHLTSLLEPEIRNRKVAIWREGAKVFVAEDETTLRAWLERRYGGEKPGKPRKVVPALLLWAENVPDPSAFPTTGTALRRLFVNSAEAMVMLGDFVLGDEEMKDVILGFAAPTGVGFGAARVFPPRKVGAPGRRVSPVTKGFRPGRVPFDHALARTLNPTAAVERTIVDRADHNWIHGRDHDASQAALRTQKVVIVGAGSVGSPIAAALARSGVGDIYVLDGEALGWENLSRHVLGAREVGSGKADSLAKHLTAALPHHVRINGEGAKLSAGSEIDWARVRAADLLITTTGDWACDSYINELQIGGDFPPVLYCWVEAHAVAAHSVFIPPDGACFACGMGELGRPLIEATTWPAGGKIQVPACGGAFTPYGAVDLLWANALHSGHALDMLLSPDVVATHRIWLGPTSRILAAGGNVAQSWEGVFGNPGDGGFTRQRAWPARHDCPACTARAAAAA